MFMGKVGNKGTETVRTGIEDGEMSARRVIQVPFVCNVSWCDCKVTERTRTGLVVRHRIGKFVRNLRMNFSLHR